MNLEQAITLLRERAEVNRAMIQNPESDFDEFCLYEATAIDVVLAELKGRVPPEIRKCVKCGKEFRVTDQKQRFCSKECRRYRNEQ